MNALQSKCLYFKGEGHCPFDESSYLLFWKYEAEWIKRSESGDSFSKEVGLLKKDGMVDFNSDSFGGERLPLSLCALLYSKCHFYGWDFYKVMKVYFRMIPADGYLFVEKVPEAFVPNFYDENGNLIKKGGWL